MDTPVQCMVNLVIAYNDYRYTYKIASLTFLQICPSFDNSYRYFFILIYKKVNVLISLRLEISIKNIKDKLNKNLLSIYHHKYTQFFFILMNIIEH